MSKTKEYSSDVHQNIVGLHKIESGCNKIAKALKNPPFPPSGQKLSFSNLLKTLDYDRGL